MGRFDVGMWFLGLSLTACMGTSAQTQRADGRQATLVLAPQLKVLQGADVYCPKLETDPDWTPCEFDVNVTWHGEPKDGICVATAATVNVRNSGKGRSAKKISWKLVWDAAQFPAADYSLEFDDDHGISILADEEWQIPRSPRSQGPDGVRKYSVRTLRSRKLNDAGKSVETVYLPLVVLTYKTSGEKRFCAASDPKIVNVD